MVRGKYFSRIRVSACVAGASLAAVMKSIETLNEYEEELNKLKEVMKDNKELVIEIPKGHEIDQEKSTFEKIVFKKTKKVTTYADVARELFLTNDYFCTNATGRTKNCEAGIFDLDDANNSPTFDQVESIMALNKLCNVAKYLNGGWLPDWSDKNEDKHYLAIDAYSNPYVDILSYCSTILSTPYFRSEKLAQQAIEILGEEEIEKALTLNH